jgi:hypothetical protein
VVLRVVCDFPHPSNSTGVKSDKNFTHV